MIDQFVNFVIRPPRAEYDPDVNLLGPHFSFQGQNFQRQDIQLVNSRGHFLECSHYLPEPFEESTSLPCVIYCHGNSGCRVDANGAILTLLPQNISVFTLDFSGSGLSQGEYVTLGKFEMQDLSTVVDHLRAEKKCSLIGLWGRSMGAVTALFYAASDPSIAGMVLDSPFWNLNHLILELVDEFKIKFPKFGVKLLVQYMRRLIRQRAHFDIQELDCGPVASRCFSPVLIGHGEDDNFIKPHHSDEIFAAYSGEKNIIKFPGNHNSNRPPFFYDSVSIFFLNVLKPPPCRDPLLHHSSADLAAEQASLSVLESSLLNPSDSIDFNSFDRELSGDEIDQLTLYQLLESQEQERSTVSDYEGVPEGEGQEFPSSMLDPGMSRSNSSLGRGRGLRSDPTQPEAPQGNLLEGETVDRGSVGGSSRRSLEPSSMEDEEEMLLAAIALSLQEQGERK